MFWAVLDLWLDRRRVEVRPDRLLLSGGILGRGKTQEIPRTQIAAIRPIRGMQAGNKLYYRIEVSTQDGKKHMAASKLGGLTLARQVVEEIQGS